MASNYPHQPLKRGGKMKPALILLLAAVLLLGGAVLAGAAWLGSDLPDPATINQQLNTPSLRVTDRSGRLLYEAFSGDGGRHTVVDLQKIPLALQQATIATEDSSFYQNPGVDLGGILRSAWINLQGGETLAGGSTITQQVARNLLISQNERSERSLRRKLRETFLAWNLAHTLSKDEILALYLNQMYYGSLTYGVEAASQTYFGKPVSELDLAESALLAGIPQSPTAYDPLQHPEAAKQRQKVVLSLMEKAGLLNTEQRTLAEGEPLVYNPTPYPIQAPHFVMMVRQEAAALVSAEEVYRLGGVTIRTTLDLDWQQHAEEVVLHQIDRLRQEEAKSTSHNLNDAALVALNPANGQILAMVGSPDYFDEQISGAVNMALAPRQPGSALKPLIYAAAFDPAQSQPWTAATLLLDVSTNFTTHDGKAYTPANYDQVEHGPVLARTALASSLNIPAVLTLQHVGMERLFAEAGSLGISTLGDPDQYDLSLALGGGEVNLLELSAAYGALADGGFRLTPQSILDIEDPQGNVIYTPTPAPRPQVIDRRAAWLITDILSDDKAREIGFGLNSVLQIGRPAAVKTGTTTNFHDNWTIGYTPDLVVGVWAGNANHMAMHEVNGLTGAAPIWAEFMRTVLNGQPEHSFTRPPGLEQVEICSFSGLLPTPACPYRRLEWFIDGTQPTRPDSIFHQVEVDTATGQLANEQTPAERKSSRLVLDLPPQAIPWAHANYQLVYSELLADQPVAAGGPTSAAGGLQFLSPANRSIYHMAAGLNGDAQRLLVKLTGGPELQKVTLWIDDRAVVTFTGAPFEFWWPLQQGQHTLRAEGSTPQGETLNSESISIEIK
jgi:penicillin-binding protein 1C